MTDDDNGADRNSKAEPDGNTKRRLTWRRPVRRRTSEFRPRRWTPALPGTSK